jgi:methionine-rich copper-binding protein CopC
MNHHRGVRFCSLLIGLLLPLALPLIVSAHSELVSAIPADGSTVSGTPEEIVLTFDADLNPDKSSIVLIDSAGTKLITAGVDPDDKRVMRLTPPAVQPGAYEVDWTSVALDDGDLLRGKVHFTISAPSAPPSAVPSEAAATSAAPSPSTSPQPAATPTPAASIAPSPTGSSGADAILPIVAAIILIAVLGAILLRGRRSGGTR